MSETIAGGGFFEKDYYAYSQKQDTKEVSVTVLSYAKEKLAITQTLMDEDDHESSMHSEFLCGTYNAYEDIVFAIENNVCERELLNAFDSVFQMAWELVKDDDDYKRLLKIKKSIL